MALILLRLLRQAAVELHEQCSKQAFELLVVLLMLLRIQLLAHLVIVLRDSLEVAFCEGTVCSGYGCLREFWLGTCLRERERLCGGDGSVIVV